MKNRRKLLAPLTLLSLFITGCVGDRAVRVEAGESICALFSEPLAYDGRFLEIEGRVMSDGIEHLLLIHSACPATGLPLEVPQTVAKLPEVRQMLRKAYDAGMQHSDDEIRGTFSGTVEARPGEVPYVILKLSGVRNLSVNGNELTKEAKD